MQVKSNRPRDRVVGETRNLQRIGMGVVTSVRSMDVLRMCTGICDAR